MADNLTVVRSDGIVDLFAAVNTGSTLALRHAATGSDGGAVLSNDFLGVQPAINLVVAGWRANSTQLYVRAFLQDESLYEWVWSGSAWAGPNKLK